MQNFNPILRMKKTCKSNQFCVAPPFLVKDQKDTTQVEVVNLSIKKSMTRENRFRKNKTLSFTVSMKRK